MNINWGAVDKAMRKECDQATAPQTNLDRIRAMSAEELAAWIAPMLGCRDCVAEGYCNLSVSQTCYQAALAWLAAPSGQEGQDANHL